MKECRSPDPDQQTGDQAPAAMAEPVAKPAPAMEWVGGRYGPDQTQPQAGAKGCQAELPARGDRKEVVAGGITNRPRRRWVEKGAKQGEAFLTGGQDSRPSF